MIKAECDRCNKNSETSRSVRALNMGFIKQFETQLPDGWYQLSLPEGNPATEPKRWDLCDVCLTELRSFLAQYQSPYGDAPAPVRDMTALPVTSVPLECCPITPGGCGAHGGPDCVCDDTSTGPEPLCGGSYLANNYAAHAREHHPENPACTHCEEPTRWDNSLRRWVHFFPSSEGAHYDHAASVLLRDRAAEKS